MKKNKILVFIITTIMILIISCNTVVLADATSGINPTNTHVSSFEKAMNVLIGIMQVVTVAVGVIMLLVLAIKYMAAAPNDKAKIKKHATVYIVGAVIAFGSYGLITLLMDFTQEALK